MVALVKIRLNGYDMGVGVDCVFSLATGFSSSGADTTGTG